MSKSTLTVIALIVVVGVGAAAGFLFLGGSSRDPGPSLDDPLVAVGRDAAREDCTVCHALYRADPHRVGPPLWNIVGAEKARFDGYAYSQALATAEGVWSEAELDAFLEDPHGFLPGTRMTFEGISDEATRQALVVFMSTLQD